MYTWTIKHEIRQLTLQLCSDGKEMYKKVCCTCKAVVLLILTYCFFDSLVAIAVVTYLTSH